MSVVAQWTPFELRETDWAAERDRLGDLVVKALERYAPGLSDLVTARRVTTPVDLETEYGLSGGHVYHGEPGLDQFFVWRPLLGHARYRLGAPRAVPVRFRGAPGWRRDGRAGRERRARDPRRPEEALLERSPQAGRKVNSIASQTRSYPIST